MQAVFPFYAKRSTAVALIPSSITCSDSESSIKGESGDGGAPP